MQKCEFCNKEGTRFRVVEKTTYWLCPNHYEDLAYRELVAHHRKGYTLTKKKLEDTLVKITKGEKPKKKKTKVEMIEH